MSKSTLSGNDASYKGNGTVTVDHSLDQTERIILQAVPALIAYIGKDLKYRYVNTSYQQWLGLREDAIIGKSVIDILGMDAYEQIKSQIQKVLNGEKCQFEYFIFNKGLRFIDASYIPDIDQHRHVKGYTIHLNDVTEKKIAERALKDYVENGNVGLHWVDEKGIIIWANAAELKLLGYRPDEYIGHPIAEFHADQGVINDILRRLAQNEVLYGYEAVLKCKDGSKKIVAINSSVYWEDGKFIHTRCFTVDITSRKEAELKLKNSEAQFRHLANSLPIAFYTCDRDGRITYYNDVAAKLWGYKPVLDSDSQKFCACYKVWMMDGTYVPPAETPMAIAIRTGQPFRNVEALVERPDGSRFYACVNIDPIVDENNNLTGAINVFQDITHLKSVELALRESQHRYQEVIELLPSAVYTCDAEGKIQLFNKAAAALWGRTPEVGKDLWCGSWKIFDPEDGTPVPLETCPMAVALKEGRSVLNKEIIVERPDGVRRNVAPNPKPIFDVSGHIVGAVNMLNDITDQKEASRALKESEQKFRMISNLVPVIIWMTDTQGSCIYLNSQWKIVTGKEASEGLGTDWLGFVHPDEKSRVQREWQKAFSALTAFNCTFRYRDIEGNYVMHQSSGVPRYDDKNSFIGYIGIFQDISFHVRIQESLETQVRERTEDLIKSNEELRESELRHHLMVSEVQDYAIILLNSDGIIENWNKGAERIKGYKAEEVVGKHFRIFYSQEDQRNHLPENFLKKATDEGKASYEGWRFRKDGSVFWGYVVLTAIHNDKNEVIGFSKVTRDLTEKKSAEDQLRTYAQKLEDKNQELEKINQELSSFAYISSHDLQEPLRKIQTFSDRILQVDESKLSPKSKEYFTRMTAAAHRMRVLIDDLLAYSRANTAEGKFVLTDLNRVLKDVQAELKETIETKQAKIHCAPLPAMHIIPLQFQQLIINLLSNALKFTKQGVAPIINISAKVVSGAEILSDKAKRDKNYVCISVSDNGIGFDPGFSSKIFEIFQRLHNRSQYEGTGVGLAICKKIAENHNGFITAASEVNQGATFNVYLSADSLGAISPS